MIALVGASGSGKDTILHKFKDRGFEVIVSYATRPPRHYEKDGEAYHFISENEFSKLAEEGFFAESVEYRGWHYGIALKDCLPGRVVVVELNGLRQLKSRVKKVTTVLIEADEDVRFNRLCWRGDDPNEIARRITTDKELFANISYDFIMKNNFNSLDALDILANTFIDNLIKHL